MTQIKQITIAGGGRFFIYFTAIIFFSCISRNSPLNGSTNSLDANTKEVDQAIPPPQKSVENKEHNLPPLNVLSQFVKLLGKPIDSLPDFGKYILKKEKIQDPEESGEYWYKVKFFNGNKLIFIAESNWDNKDNVARITICSKEIKDGDIFIEQNVGKIRNMLEEQLPPFPDGYLFAKLKQSSKIILELDNKNLNPQSDLYYASTLAEIPDTLKVKSIIIQ